MSEKLPKKIDFKVPFSFKRLGIVVILVLVSAIVICYPIWSRFSETIESQNQQIGLLESQIDSLNEKIDAIIVEPEPETE